MSGNSWETASERDRPRLVGKVNKGASSDRGVQVYAVYTEKRDMAGRVFWAQPELAW